MKGPDFRFSLKYRSILYIFFGISCALLDISIFNLLIKLIEPLYANPVGYFTGSVCSYLLNKKYTFKSNNTKLSLNRYFIILFLGFLNSQIIIFIGINSLGLYDYVVVIKFIAMLVSAIIQFIGNNLFSSIKK